MHYANFSSTNFILFFLIAQIIKHEPFDKTFVNNERKINA